MAHMDWAWFNVPLDTF